MKIINQEINFLASLGARSLAAYKAAGSHRRFEVRFNGLWLSDREFILWLTNRDRAVPRFARS